MPSAKSLSAKSPSSKSSEYNRRPMTSESVLARLAKGRHSNRAQRRPTRERVAHQPAARRRSLQGRIRLGPIVTWQRADAPMRQANENTCRPAVHGDEHAAALARNDLSHQAVQGSLPNDHSVSDLKGIGAEASAHDSVKGLKTLACHHSKNARSPDWDEWRPSPREQCRVRRFQATAVLASNVGRFCCVGEFRRVLELKLPPTTGRARGPSRCPPASCGVN
jgi:hypothetical protein